MKKLGTQPEIVPKVTAIYDKDNKKLEGLDLINATAEFFETQDNHRPRPKRIKSRYSTI